MGWKEVIRAGRTRAKRRKMTTAASRFQDQETKNNHHGTKRRGNE